MSINPRIFRQYDVRGVVDRDLTPEAVELLGRGYGTYVAGKGVRRVSVGYDARLSSPGFCEALTCGIASTGVDVIQIGLVATPTLYFSFFHLDVGGGVMITGSHNPPEFNGFKLGLDRTTIHGDEIQAVLHVIQSGQVEVLQRKDDKEFCLATLGKGDFFGEMALFQEEVRPATVRSVGKTTVMTLEKKTLLQRIHQDPSLAFRLLQKMSTRIRELETALVGLSSSA